MLSRFDGPRPVVVWSWGQVVGLTLRCSGAQRPTFFMPEVTSWHRRRREGMSMRQSESLELMRLLLQAVMAAFQAYLTYKRVQTALSLRGSPSVSSSSVPTDGFDAFLREMASSATSSGSSQAARTKDAT